MDATEDLYGVLGVAEDASAEDIKRAYRTLARRWHPDANGGDAQAEERFKNISHAHDILGDPDKRAEYDALRRMGTAGGGFGTGYGYGPGFDPSGFGAHGDPRMFDGGGFDFGAMFGQMFPGGALADDLPLRGGDLSVDVTVAFDDALRGTTVPITITRADGTTETHSVKIPAGAKDGTRVRLKGRGSRGTGGAPDGDLEVRVRMLPHRHFTRTGDGDVRVAVPVTLGEAALGARVDVPLPAGGRVKVTIPAGSQDGRTLRVAGKGAPRLTGSGTGDLLVQLRVQVPTDLTDSQRQALAAYAKLEDTDVRKDLLR